jgi:hypothetical protein
MTDKNNIEKNIEERPLKTFKTNRILVWVSVALAVLSWILLMMTNGYIALSVGIAAVVAGFIAATKNENNMRRLAITATIAAVVLVVVLASFIIVIKVGLGS